jgi:hypothetical protein
MIMSFAPRDVIEAMLASHCLMFHELIVNGAAEALRGDTDTPGRVARGNIVAHDKCFGNNPRYLERYQGRLLKDRDDVATQLCLRA